MKKLTKYIKITIGVISFCLINTIMAQDISSEKNRPLGYTISSLSEITTNKILPAKDIDSIVQFDKRMRQRSRRGFPHRIGYQNRINTNIMNSSFWQKVDKDRIVLFNLKIEDAKAVYLLFEKFWLPNGSKLFIYNKQKTHFVGPYNHTNNNGSRTHVKGFCSGMVAGDEIIVEYHPPENNNLQAIIILESIINVYNPPGFIVNEIKEYFQAKGYDYSGYGDFLLSGDCQVNVNCSPEGDNWHDEKKSVVLILRSNGTHCTGFLINNTRNDDTPLLITANHCLEDDLSLWNFYFMYEADASVCPYPEWGDEEPSAVELTNGGTLLAHDSDLDFALLKLTKNPKEVLSEDSIYYAGWDRTNDQPNGGVGIHHPQGDVKMISTVDGNQYPNETDCFDYYPVLHWGIGWKETVNNWSALEYGSSGSPLFNANSKVIGQCRGTCFNADNPCDNPGGQYAVYGKFYNSWNNGSNQNERLKDWLDPYGINPTALDGRYSGSSMVNPCKYDPDGGLVKDFTITTDLSYPVQCNSYTFQNVTIKNNASVTVNYDENVILESGFEVKLGSSFKTIAQE